MVSLYGLNKTQVCPKDDIECLLSAKDCVSMHNHHACYNQILCDEEMSGLHYLSLT